MSRVVRCGIIQASSDVDPAQGIEALRQGMIEKHIPMIEEAAAKAAAGRAGARGGRRRGGRGRRGRC